MSQAQRQPRYPPLFPTRVLAATGRLRPFFPRKLAASCTLHALHFSGGEIACGCQGMRHASLLALILAAVAKQPAVKHLVDSGASDQYLEATAHLTRLPGPPKPTAHGEELRQAFAKMLGVPPAQLRVDDAASDALLGLDPDPAQRPARRRPRRHPLSLLGLRGSGCTCTTYTTSGLVAGSGHRRVTVMGAARQARTTRCLAWAWAPSQSRSRKPFAS